MPQDRFTVALIPQTFTGAERGRELREALTSVRDRGAELAVLPELPLDRWMPATRDVRADDAESPAGERHRVLAEAARECGIGVVGGAIVVDPKTGDRHNTALVFDGGGELVGSYRKVHLPEEPGFWETSHYVPGSAPPQRIDAFSMPTGVQICSDVNRPQGCHLLGALGAELIVVPRATEPGTWERWLTVLRANALTSGCYLISVNRPEPEGDAPLGGPSVAIDPDGEVIAEGAETCVVELSRELVRGARGRYPGYMAWAAGVYVEGWRAVADGAGRD